MSAKQKLLTSITRELERAARTYLETTEMFAKGAITVAAVRDPALFGCVAEGVRRGELIPQIHVSGGVVKISLKIAKIGEVSPPLFEYPTTGG